MIKCTYSVLVLLTTTWLETHQVHFVASSDIEQLIIPFTSGFTT